MGRAIARRLSFTAGEGAYAFKTAYDERFARCSPGVMLEADNVRQLDAAPGVQWMDSFTADANLALERMWPERRRIETLAAPLGAWGGLAAAALVSACAAPGGASHQTPSLELPSGSAQPAVAADWWKDAKGPTRSRGLILLLPDPPEMEAMSFEVAERLGAETARLDDHEHCWMAQAPAVVAPVLKRFWTSLG